MCEQKLCEELNTHVNGNDLHACVNSRFLQTTHERATKVICHTLKKLM